MEKIPLGHIDDYFQVENPNKSNNRMKKKFLQRKKFMKVNASVVKSDEKRQGKEGSKRMDTRISREKRINGFKTSRVSLIKYSGNIDRCSKIITRVKEEEEEDE